MKIEVYHHHALTPEIKTELTALRHALGKHFQAFNLKLLQLERKLDIMAETVHEQEAQLNAQIDALKNGLTILKTSVSNLDYRVKTIITLLKKQVEVNQVDLSDEIDLLGKVSFGLNEVTSGMDAMFPTVNDTPTDELPAPPETPGTADNEPFGGQ